MIDYTNPKSSEYVKKFKELQEKFEQDVDLSDESQYLGKDGSNFDKLSRDFHKKIKTLQNEYKDIFIKE